MGTSFPGALGCQADSEPSSRAVQAVVTSGWPAGSLGLPPLGFRSNILTVLRFRSPFSASLKVHLNVQRNVRRRRVLRAPRVQSPGGAAYTQSGIYARGRDVLRHTQGVGLTLTQLTLYLRHGSFRRQAITSFPLFCGSRLRLSFRRPHSTFPY